MDPKQVLNKAKVAALQVDFEQKLTAMQQLVDDSKLVKKEAMKKVVALQKMLDRALAIQGHTHRQPVMIKSRRKTSVSTAHVVMSDWHVEETVDPQTINGVNEFNLDIAEFRMSKAFENALTLIKINQSGTRIDAVVLSLLGDFMTGWIHEELMCNNSLTPLETILWLKERMVPLIEEFIAELRRMGITQVIIPCTVGNHGRTTKRRMVALQVKTNLEWLLYCDMANAIPYADWQIAAGAHVYVNNFGFVTRHHHGDDLRYNGGVGGITIPVLKAIKEWNSIKDADYDVFGHWHQYLPHSLFHSNPSLIGYGPYALSIKAPYQQPAQGFFLIEKDHRRPAMKTPIFLD